MWGYKRHRISWTKWALYIAGIVHQETHGGCIRKHEVQGFWIPFWAAALKVDLGRVFFSPQHPWSKIRVIFALSLVSFSYPTKCGTIHLIFFRGFFCQQMTELLYMLPSWFGLYLLDMLLNGQEMELTLKKLCMPEIRARVLVFFWDCGDTWAFANYCCLFSC